MQFEEGAMPVQLMPKVDVHAAAAAVKGGRIKQDAWGIQRVGGASEDISRGS
jgi:hypothetical protein